MEKESRLLRTFIRGTEDQKGLHTDKKCANEHGLIRFNTPSEYGCDLCYGPLGGGTVEQQRFPKDTVMYGCDECNYDICISCESMTTTKE